MAIPRNKNLTKQLNSYSYVIAITLQGLLQRTKRALNNKVMLMGPFKNDSLSNTTFYFNKL